MSLSTLFPPLYSSSLVQRRSNSFARSNSGLIRKNPSVVDDPPIDLISTLREDQLFSNANANPSEILLLDEPSDCLLFENTLSRDHNKENTQPNLNGKTYAKPNRDR